MIVPLPSTAPDVPQFARFLRQRTSVVPLAPVGRLRTTFAVSAPVVKANECVAPSVITSVPADVGLPRVSPPLPWTATAPANVLVAPVNVLAWLR